MTIERFLDEWVKKSGSKTAATVALGLCNYFDRLLPARLLYRSEMPQHKELLSQPKIAAKKFSQIYGVEHLLRLFGTGWFGDAFCCALVLQYACLKLLICVFFCVLC